MSQPDPTVINNPPKWFIGVGLKSHGPFTSALEAEKWATENIEKGQTYILEKQEDFI